MNLAVCPKLIITLANERTSDTCYYEIKLNPQLTLARGRVVPHKMLGPASKQT